MSPASGLDRRKRLVFSLIALAMATLAGLAFGEIAVRAAGSFDDRGDFRFFGMRLKPWALPPANLESRIEEYLARREDATIGYDPDLGWCPVPGSASESGLLFHNAQAIRTGSGRPVYAPVPTDGVPRIAVLGDSFAAALDVPFESTWGFLVERRLAEAGIPAEVLNLGVGAYGMDQALLRFKRDGRALAPDVVIFGFQAENANRNLNLFRPFCSVGTSTFFTKPRLIVEPDGLRTVNVPTVPPERILEVVTDYGSWDLAPYDLYFDPDDYADRSWRRSRLLATVEAFLASRSSDAKPFPYRYEQSRPLALAIVRELDRSVRESGASFLVVHLPTLPYTLKPLLAGEPLAYRDLLDEIDREFTVIDPTDEMLRAAREHSVESLFVPGGHYSPEGNGVVAEVVAAFLADRKEARDP